jgi:predicted enzyme related to lactoylglutathione lyase
MKLDNFRLLVNDFSASLQFWHEIMGLTLLYKGEDQNGEGVYAYFQADGARLELLRANYFATSVGAPIPDVTASTQAGCRGVISFKVEDVDGTYAELIKRGATSLSAPRDRPHWPRTAHLQAPDGYAIELFKPLDSVPWEQK